MALHPLLNIGVIVIIIGMVITLLYFKISKQRSKNVVSKGSPAVWHDQYYSIEQMTTYVKEFLHEHVNENLYARGLSGEELRRRNNKRLELKRALKGCVYGDIQDKQFVKDLIYDLLQQTYGLTEEHMNQIIPFEDVDRCTDQDLFEIILFINKQHHGLNTLSHLIQTYHLDCPMYSSENGDVESYRITAEDIRRIYQKEARTLSFEQKLHIIVQRIYQSYKGFSVIDEIRDMRIDGVSGGVSGHPAWTSMMDLAGQMTGEPIQERNTIPKSYDSIWIFYRGKSIHLSFLSFGSEQELKRVCQNIYKYNNPGQLSETVGYKVNEMKDGSRVVVVRPHFAESWAFFVRKFDIPRATLESLIQDPNAEMVIGLLKYLMKGARITAITGQQGSGKTTLLMALVKHIYGTLTLRVQEMAFELHLRKIYPYRNILSFRETDHIRGQDGLDVQKKTDGAVNIIGEAATDPVASWVIQSAQVASLFTLFTHHAKTFKDLVFSLRNSLLKTGVFSNEHIAEQQVVNVIGFDVHLRMDRNGHRYIERITECIPLEGAPTFEARNIIEYRDGAYWAGSRLSERSVRDMIEHMTVQDTSNFYAFMDQHWRGDLGD
ncbi:pilus assembly protein CpaF [Paenibacillus selenitireducens]|uniref:Pilus assembly protein CpaF n=1 Tax=Paenibacillus selenitireducens TaxID=1324314 RepID=A0A1T2X500_9BACL|nr:Flp pilus assembly complex ATPase component TadA [Paenibacillus selenitireducens]OPA74653.1 pilus assembly protein CpaF [Paenibacillus selenitireducens]